MNTSKITISKVHTPFLYECKYGSKKGAVAMLANPATNPAEGNSAALFIAVDNGWLKFFKALLADGRADPMAAKGALFKKALATGNWHFVDALVSDPRVKIPNDSSLYITAMECYHHESSVFDTLLTYVDPSGDDNTALMFAIASDNDRIVDMLIEDPRIDPTQNNYALIRYAIQFGNMEALDKLLWKPNVDPSADDNILIDIASNFVGDSHQNDLCAGRLLLDPRVVAGKLPLEELGGIENAKALQADAHRYVKEGGDFWKRWAGPLPEIKEPEPAPAPEPAPEPAPAPAPAPEPAPAPAPKPAPDAEMHALRENLQALREQMAVLESRISAAAPNA